MLRLCVLMIGLAVLASCGSNVAASGADGCSAGGTCQDQAAEDIAAYENLATKLEGHRTQFLSKQYSEQNAVENQLFFVDFPGWNAVLHRWDGTTQKRVDYTFSGGSGDQFNYRASSSLLVTANSISDRLSYNAYDPAMANSLLGTLTMDKPQGDQRWWAYAVDGNTLWLVTEQSPTETWLNRWSPGGTLEKLFTLEQATGQSTLGEFLEFEVVGDTMTFVEGGRLWTMSIAKRKATWTHNSGAIVGSISFQSDRVLWQQSHGLFELVFGDSAPINVSDEIEKNPYKLNATYATIHHHVGDGDFWCWRDWLVYRGAYGIFAYNLKSATITPVLLDPRSDRTTVTYRYPVVLDNGLLFVTGLESTSGDVGVDGPIWELDLTKILP